MVDVLNKAKEPRPLGIVQSSMVKNLSRPDNGDVTGYVSIIHAWCIDAGVPQSLKLDVPGTKVVFRGKVYP